jgi:quinone-modifying oxidoreductase subunit QmoB
MAPKKPRIAIVPCQWHPQTAMENAARDGYTYDADAVVMPVKCTGLVKVSFLLKLFARKLDGVLVLGCRNEDCRYRNGSERCAEIVGQTREILELSGIDPEKLEFDQVSEAQGGAFRKVLDKFVKRLKPTGGKRRKSVSKTRHR